MQTAQASRLLTGWGTPRDELAHPRHATKRPHFRMVSIYLRRYTPPFAIVSVHQNVCAAEQACEWLSDRLGDASQISAKRAKSMKS